MARARRDKQQVVVATRWSTLAREEQANVDDAKDVEKKDVKVSERRNIPKAVKSLVRRPYRIIRGLLPFIGNGDSHQVFLVQLLLVLLGNGPKVSRCQLMQQPFEVSQELDEHLRAQVTQQRSFDYLVSNNQDQQQQLYKDLEDLLESSTSHQTSTNSTSSQGKQDEEKPSASSSSSPSSSAASLLAEQISAVTSLLDHFGSTSSSQSGHNGQSVAQELISGVSNSILEPLRSSSASSSGSALGSGKVRAKTGASQQQQVNAQASTQTATISVPAATTNNPQRPQVGQSIDGNIEYDPNQNAINGFIEWPSFNFSGGNRPGAALTLLKPLALAALKTVPVKLGSVGWKLLQLIAWKKIYKTHHPKSGEIVFEQELHTASSKNHHHDDSSSAFLEPELAAASSPRSAKTPARRPRSSRSQSGSGSGGGSSKRANQHLAWQKQQQAEYQRHLLAAGQLIQPAAMAAAATAAAIQQSQWAALQQQQQQQLEDLDGGVLGRFRRQRSLGAGTWQPPNWFASGAPTAAAQAYATAAAAAAAALARHQPNLNSRFGLQAAGAPAEELGASLQMYQNLLTPSDFFPANESQNEPASSSADLEPSWPTSTSWSHSQELQQRHGRMAAGLPTRQAILANQNQRHSQLNQEPSQEQQQEGLLLGSATFDEAPYHRHLSAGFKGSEQELR